MEDRDKTRIVDLSHVIDGWHDDLQGPAGPAHLRLHGRARQSAANYDDGSTFQIGRIDMVANTGTYVDVAVRIATPTAQDLSEMGLESLADLPALVVRQPWENGLVVDAGAFDGPRRARQRGAGRTPAGTGTGGSDAYYQRSSLPDRRRRRLAGRERRGAGRHRQPQYRRHAGADAAGAHEPARRRNPDLRAYDQPRRAAGRGFRFTAAPPKVKGMGTFPVRAYAVLD